MNEYLFIYRDHNGKHRQLTTKADNVLLAMCRFVDFCKEQRIDPVSVTVDRKEFVVDKHAIPVC